MTYFLGFLGLDGSGSGFAFGGLPLPGTLRMASRADLSYTASFVIGFMSALKSRMFTVLTGTPRISAISVIVYPSIYFSSSLSLRGWPGPGTAFKMSKTSGAYMASLVIGLMPNLVSLCRRVLTGTSSSFDISESVNPVISSIIGNFIKRFNKCTVKSTNRYTCVKQNIKIF